VALLMHQLANVPRAGLGAVINEELITSNVMLTHAAFLGFKPAGIQLTEQPSGNGQLSELVLKRVNNSETVEWPIDRQDAMSRWDK